MTEQDRAGRARADTARHLNQSYPDALLFLAHHAADRPDATTAQIVDIDDSSLHLQVTTDEGVVGTVEVRLPDADPEADLRPRVRELLRLTRLQVPDVPLTSLEQRAHTPPMAPPDHGHQ